MRAYDQGDASADELATALRSSPHESVGTDTDRDTVQRPQAGGRIAPAPRQYQNRCLACSAWTCWSLFSRPYMIAATCSSRVHVDREVSSACLLYHRTGAGRFPYCPQYVCLTRIDTTIRQTITNGSKWNCSRRIGMPDHHRQQISTTRQPVRCFEISLMPGLTPVVDQRILVHEPSRTASKSPLQFAVFHEEWTAAHGAGEGDE